MKKNSNKEEFIFKAEKYHGKNRYDYSNVVYEKAKIKIEIRCILCNNVFKQTPDHHLRGNGCPKCGIISRSEKRKSNKQEFTLKAVQIHGNKYDYSKFEYINSITKGKIKCLTCNIFFEQSPNDHLASSGCRYCGIKVRTKKKTKSREQFILEAIEIHGYKYDYSEFEYISNKTPGKIKCLTCNNISNQTPGNHLSGHGCKKCTKSRGEERILIFLKENRIQFNFQHTFDNCKNKHKLPFDFYLPDFNLCIEYNGFQHYAPVKYFGGIDRFEALKINDNIKQNYCLNNNIRLIQISYQDFQNIEQILKHEVLDEKIW